MNDGNKAWAVLIVAGFCEIVWAIAMDYSDGFMQIGFDIVFVAFLILSMYLLSKALNLGVPIGTGYAVWTGIGAIGTIAVSVALGNETIDALRVLFVMMIITGIVGLQLTSENKGE